MRSFQLLSLSLLWASLPACGDRLVEFPLADSSTVDASSVDAPPNDGRLPDASNDGSIDGSIDGAVDASLDAAAVRPTVIATSPLANAINVSVNKIVTATFSVAMNPATITGLTFTVKHAGVAVPGVVTYVAATNSAVFTPTVPLTVAFVYQGTITTGAADPAGTTLAADYVWNFTVGACSLEVVNLRSVGNFAVLGGPTVTSTGPTSVTGDLGTSPGAAIIGFPPGIVIGNQVAGTPVSAAAMADLTTAYNDAAGRSLCSITVAGNLGGQTLAPGLYHSTSSLSISAGDLTLDAQGDVDAVWIFQMASTLTTTAGRQVILAGGARAGNIYWQVGTSATIGTTSAFKGTVMADQAITLNTGATLTGRTLARIAAVSLDSNTIVKPVP